MALFARGVVATALGLSLITGCPGPQGTPGAPPLQASSAHPRATGAPSSVGSVALAPPPASSAPPSSAPAPRVFPIADASKAYTFQLTILDGCPEPDKGEDCRGPAQLVISPKDGTASRVIHLDEAWVEADEQGKLIVNSTELYGEPGTINVGDFNFDNREDFAVLSGMSGPYGGPTFTVFLASPSGDFVRSPELSALTEETLGLFQVDAKKKRLITLSKSGCCYHVTEELAVVNDKPVPMFRETEDGTGDVIVTTRERRVGGTWRKSTQRGPLPKPE